MDDGELHCIANLPYRLHSYVYEGLESNSQSSLHNMEGGEGEDESNGMSRPPWGIYPELD